VIVIVEAEAPSAFVGVVPVIVVVELEAAPATKLTVPPVNVTGDDKLKVFVSACADLSVHVETPEEFVVEHVV
jgi:hypothetical protein